MKKQKQKTINDIRFSLDKIETKTNIRSNKCYKIKKSELMDLFRNKLDVYQGIMINKLIFLSITSKATFMSTWLPTFIVLSQAKLTHTHTHTHTIYIYIYIYIYIEECIFRQQVIIQVSFIKDDGTLFIISNFIFSRLLVIFQVVGSRW